MATKTGRRYRLLPLLLAAGTFIALPAALICMIAGTATRSQPLSIAAIVICGCGATCGYLRGRLKFGDSEENLGSLYPLLVFLAVSGNIMLGLLAFIAW